MNFHLNAKLAQRAFDYSKRLDQKKFVFLLLAGLLVRLIGSFLYGTQDMEWWKAWGVYATQQSLTGIYGTTDQEIFDLWREGQCQPLALKEGLAVLPTQTIVHFASYRYFRTEYILTQPPLYIYSLDVFTRLYGMISPELANNRVFNFFINLEPIISSAVLAWLISLFVSNLANRSTGKLAGLVYWLNPLVILNAPIQGYRDPLCALFTVISVVMLYRKNLSLAFVCLALAFMYKPQGVLIAPVVVLVGLREHRFNRNLLAWIVAGLTSLAVCLPYIITNHFLGLVQGVLSITQMSSDLSRQAMNIWWPVQYLANAHVLITEKGVSILQALTGYDGRVINDLPISKFESMMHVNAGTIGFALLGVFTIINLWYVWRRLQSDRNSIIIAAALQIYGYFILRAGVQINHYFILIPLFTLLAFLNAISLRRYLMICSIFFIQDWIFYGFGRDFNFEFGRDLNHGWRMLSISYLAWTTNLLALANVGLFIFLCWNYYTLKEPLLSLRERFIPKQKGAGV